MGILIAREYGNWYNKVLEIVFYILGAKKMIIKSFYIWYENGWMEIWRRMRSTSFYSTSGQLLQAKAPELVTHWSNLPHGYYKPVDKWLVLQQLAVGEATGDLYL